MMIIDSVLKMQIQSVSIHLLLVTREILHIFITFIQFCVQRIEKCSLNQIKYVLCDKYKVQILNAGTIPGNIF